VRAADVRLLGRQHGPSAGPAPGFVQAVTDLLAPRFELPRSLGAAIKGDDRELLRLTEDQFRCARHALAPAARGGVGRPGHGQDDARAGKGEAPGGGRDGVLLTCYNRPLADYLRQAAGPCERLTVAKITTRSAGTWRRRPATRSRTRGSRPAAGFWERTLPDALLAATPTRLPRASTRSS